MTDANGWRPIAEAPLRKRVLTWAEWAGMFSVEIAERSPTAWRNDGGAMVRPTHWQPLPPPPLTAQEGGR